MTGSRVFISYVRENHDVVSRLVRELRNRNVDVWFDRQQLSPGVFWQDEIRLAVRDNGYFLACFSNESNRRERTYMNEELELAIAELRLRGNSRWFIPVLLSGEVPDRQISAGRSLRDIHYVDLSGEQWNAGIEALCLAVGAHPRLGSMLAENRRAEAPVEPLGERGAETIDVRSLTAFVEKDDIVVSISRDIAAKLGAGVVTPQGSALTTHIAALAALGIRTIGQLEQRLLQDRKALLRFAAKALENSRGRMLSGTVSLHYLERLLLARAADASLAASFLKAINRAEQDPIAFLAALRRTLESAMTTA